MNRCVVLLLAFVALGLISAEDVAAKCSPQLQMPGLGSNEVVTLVDGAVMVASELEELNEMDASDIHSVTITCWNPATGEFGAGGRIPVIVLLTKRFVESTRAPIEGLLRAQEAHFSQFSRYAESLDDLVGFGVPPDATLEFSATSAGWSAATPRVDVAYRCFVFSGDAAQELAGMKQREVVCRLGATAAVRALYEAGGGEAR